MSPLSQYKRYNKKVKMFYDGAYSRIVCYGHANVMDLQRFTIGEEICHEGSGQC